MSHFTLLCSNCKAAHPAVMKEFACRDCGAPLDVHYKAAPAGEGPLPVRRELPGIWRYWGRFPLHREESIVSLGEGSTPCIELPRLGRRLGLEVYAKLECLNPTGSFKDRGMTVLVSVAREEGVGELVEDSSGNAGSSLAAYCARAGIVARVFAPEGASPFKLGQVRFYGARLELIGGGREAVARAARDCALKGEGLYWSHNWAPYFIEGMKSFAYEVAEQLPEVGHIVIPVGNGSLLLGAFRGFLELKGRGLVGRLPRLHCIQAELCMPTVAAFEGREWTPPVGVRTIAGGISLVNPPRKGQVVEAVRATGGSAVAVSEEGIIAWQRLLAQEEGIFAEPTSAAAFAGLEALVSGGGIGKGEVVLVPVTGFGLKDAIPG
jgi:threonine synthase